MDEANFFQEGVLGKKFTEMQVCTYRIIPRVAGQTGRSEGDVTIEH